MDTRGKSNTEFRNEVSKILARHESNFDQIHATLQTILTVLQALKAQTNIPTTGDVKPFVVNEAYQSTKHYPEPRTSNSTLKLNFPKFTGEDPTEWIYRAEQYFAFQGIVPTQQVQLASFHLKRIALQWHRWFPMFKGPVSWTKFTTALLHRFGPTEDEKSSEALTHLKHTTTTNPPFVFKWQEKIIFIAFTIRFNTSFCLSLIAMFKDQKVNWLFLAFLFTSWDPGGFVILCQP